MKLKISLGRAQDKEVDLTVVVDATVPVATLAETIARRDPSRQGVTEAAGLTLQIQRGHELHPLPPRASMAESGLRPGDIVELVESTRADGAGTRSDVVGFLAVLEGPQTGERFPLLRGANLIGRATDNDIRLSDPLVSKRHARITVADGVEIVDLGSANGIVSGDVAVPRASLANGDTLLLGETLVQVAVHDTDGQPGQTNTEFNRPPRVLPTFPGEKVDAPEPPQRPRRQRTPWVAIAAPILMGMILFAVTQRLISVLFVALSPIMAVGNIIETRYFGRKEYEAALEHFHASLTALVDRLQTLAEREVRVRRIEHPHVREIIEAAEIRGSQLWARRTDLAGFLDLRFGLGSMPSRTVVDVPRRNDADPDLWERLDEVVERFHLVHGVPVVASLGEVGDVGIAGDRDRILDSARSAVYHLVGLHSPAELVLCALAPAGSEADWDWLKWIPHVSSEHSPITGDHLASSAGTGQRLVSLLEEVVDDRKAEPSGGPAIILLVEDASPVERSRLVRLAEEGPAVGLHLVWLAAAGSDLPAACRSFLVVDRHAPGIGEVGFVRDGHVAADVELDSVDPATAYRTARTLAPIVDSGARVDDQSDLPRSVSLLTLLGPDLVTPEAVTDRWRTSGSLPNSLVGRGRPAGLRAVVGVATAQEFVLDLREHGPHALVGGTTGSGKSEFLQSWVMAMAAEHSASRVTFLLIDYKGGAAFGRCVDLPHTVGLVTDLSPHLVRRALTSLRAELHHRERLLNRKGVKDLIELERRGDAEAPPSLVIVVDEFAALVGESPEFVDGVVDVAQRGRSLGLHLILATQRPAGVIRDNLRANTNLRVALRMADETDSDDVVGNPQAASFDPGIPGRGLVKIGPGRLTAFQSGYIGGWTTEVPPPPVIVIDELRFGVGSRWDEPESGPSQSERLETGPNDLARLVASISAAHRHLELAHPRRPWLDELAAVYDLAKAPQSRTDKRLVFAIQDEPELQRQTEFAYLPDHDGNLAVYGTGGAGKSTLLRTLAVVAGLGQSRGGPCHVYALDFGARGLQMLEPLPHVGAVITGDDEERTIRLLRTLRDQVDSRAERYAAVNAGSIGEFRRLAEQPSEPRILLLVDNISAFRQSYEAGIKAQWFDAFQAIAASGRPVGVHVVVTADRPSAIPAALGSAIPRRLALRLADESDYTTLGVPHDALGPDSPPGRGFIGNREMQTVVLGGTTNVVRQAKMIEGLARHLDEAGTQPAAPVGRLTDMVALGALPDSVNGQPTLGLSSETLSPIGFDVSQPYLIVGPPQSGKSSALATVALSLRRWRTGFDLVLLAPRSSALSNLLGWADRAEGPSEVASLAEKLAQRLRSEQVSPALAVVVDDIPEFLNEEADVPLQDLLKACRAAGVFVAAASEISQVSAYGPLMQSMKAPQHGIALRPEQGDGDTAFKTSFPRVAKSAFPAGRGLAVRSGRFSTVQVAYPELQR